MEYTGQVLGTGLSYSISLLSPDVIVIGGGGAMAGDRLLKPVRDTLSRSVYHGYLDRLTIRQGELIDDGGVIGSAAFAKRRAEKLRQTGEGSYNDWSLASMRSERTAVSAVTIRSAGKEAEGWSIRIARKI